MLIRLDVPQNALSQRRLFRPVDTPRLFWLDVLRGVAVMLVLFGHCAPLPDATPYWLRTMLSPLITAGWMGVDLFFVLSGFLVGSLLLKPIAENSEVSISRFLIRRGFKIYPSFYLLLFLTIVAVETLTNRILWQPVLTEALFIQNYLPGVWEHTWSLAVEEHFYLLIAALVGSLARVKNQIPSVSVQSLPMIICTVMVSCLILRVLQYVYIPEQRGAIYRSTHLRMDTLFAGVLLAFAVAFHASEFFRIVNAHRVRIAILATALILPPWIQPLSTNGFAGAFFLTIGFSLLALGCAGWVAIVVNANTPSAAEPARIWRAVRFIGIYSYAIYLWHLPVKKLFPIFYLHLTGDVPGQVTQFILYFGGTIVLAILTSRAFEFPLLRWRDRLISSNRRGNDSVMRGHCTAEPDVQCSMVGKLESSSRSLP